MIKRVIIDRKLDSSGVIEAEAEFYDGRKKLYANVYYFDGFFYGISKKSMLGEADVERIEDYEGDASASKYWPIFQKLMQLIATIYD